MQIDFQNRQSAHCETGVTANLLRYHGLEISEPMVLGISGGIFFGYFPFIQVAYIKVTTFRTYPGGVFKNAVKRLGMRYESRTYWRKSSAERDLNRALDEGRPAGCQVGMFWLPYLPAAFRSHFNAHNIVVYGRDQAGYVIGEPAFPQPMHLTAKELSNARFSKGGMNPNGRMYWLKEDRSPKSVDLRRPILLGLKHACFYMLHTPFPILGIRGIRYMARDVLRWQRMFSKEKLLFNLNQIVIMQEVMGSGGAGFRFMYAAFLKEAADILKSAELEAASLEMTAIGDRWRDFALVATRFCKGRPDPGDNFQAMAGIIMECADREEKMFQGLEAYAVKALKG